MLLLHSGFPVAGEIVFAVATLHVVFEIALFGSHEVRVNGLIGNFLEWYVSLVLGGVLHRGGRGQVGQNRGFRNFGVARGVILSGLAGARTGIKV